MGNLSAETGIPLLIYLPLHTRAPDQSVDKSDATSAPSRDLFAIYRYVSLDISQRLHVVPVMLILRYHLDYIYFV